MKFLNKDIEKALTYANTQMDTVINYLSDTYGITKFWNNKDDVRWDDLVTFHNSELNLTRKPSKFALAMLVYLLENNLYKEKYSEKLYRDLPFLQRCLKYFKTVYSDIFNEGYSNLYFIDRKPSKKAAGLIIRRINDADNFFGSLYRNYITEESGEIHYVSSKIDLNFMRSVEGMTINSLDDINSSLFWHQINSYKTLYKDDEYILDMALKNVCKFYRWIVRTNNEYSFFNESTTLTYELLFSTALIKHIKSDAYFTTLTQTEDLGDKSKIVFIIKNLHNHSTRMVKNSHFALYMDNIETSEYRKIIIKYVQNSISATLLTWTGPERYIVDALHFIERMKKHGSYPNPSVTHFTTPEAIAIRDYFKKSNPDLNIITLNNKIGAVRRFLQWCESCSYLTFDSTFFDYLSQYEEPNKYYGDAIPDEDIKKINNEFVKLCKEDNLYKLYYAIFLILLETEFRVSQVCNLTVSSIQPTLKNDQFLIYSNTKTSVGRKVTQPICLATKKILDSIIEETEHLRNEVIQESYKDHIFLYQTYVNKTIRGINSDRFYDVFQKVCEKAGTKRYNTCNLRDTHMTKAFEFIMRNGKSDLEMGLLSKHSCIDTTKNHYIELELTKMLESTYQVTLGNRDINTQNKIIDSVPDELNNNDSVVENGCGRCTSKTCTMTGSLPCLVCQNFVTTIEHKPYFIKMIENCDVLLNNATVRHEIEDLNLIKTLYTNWLREICIKEEEGKCLDNL